MKSKFQKTRVLHFLPRWTNGGMEHAVLDIVSHFEGEKFKFEICTAFQESDFGLEQMREKEITFLPCGTGKYSFLESSKRFYQRLKNEKVDIVHCHINNSIGLVFAFVAKVAGVDRIVVHTHNNAFGEGRLQLKKVIRHMSLLSMRNIPDLYLACSDDAGRWTFGEDITKSGKYHVIYNGVSLKKYAFHQAVREQLRIDYGLIDKFVIGHIGHFNYQKNQIYLLSMVREVISRIPNAHFFFIGSGETKEAFVQQLRDDGLEMFVTVIETVNNPQDYYAMFDLFVFPSHFEGFGLVMIEAQMNGLQIICSDKVPRETDVTGHVCYLPIVGDDCKSMWVNAIEKSVHQIDFINRNDEVFCEKFDINKISRTIETYYNELMRE